MALGVGCTLGYLVWRAGWSLGGASWWLSVPLFVGEVIAALALIALVGCAWRSEATAAPRRRRPEPVDIYVLAGAWSADVVRSTLLACAEVRGHTRTWVLHHGRPDIAALAAALGHESLEVPTDDPVGAVTHACGRTTGDLVLLLDGSDLPLPDALHSFGAVFDDPWCAVLQLRRGAYNHEGARHLGIGRDVRSVHDEVVLPGLDSFGAAHWEGAGAILRRVAMVEVGQHSGPAGALGASVALQSAGWSIRARREVVAVGLAPDDEATLVRESAARQRAVSRWFASSQGPWRTPGLTPAQRLGHTVTAAAALHATAWARVLRVVVLAVALCSATTPFPLNAATVGLLWLPAMLTGAVAAAVARGGRLSAADVAGLELSRLPLPFDRARRCPPAALPAALASLLAVGVAVSVVRLVSVGPSAQGRFGLAVLVVAGTVGFARQVGAAWRHRRTEQRRSAHRFSCEEPAVLGDAPATVVNVSSSGTSLLLDAPVGVGGKASMEMWLDTPDGSLASVSTHCTILWCAPEGGRWVAGVRFDRPPVSALDHIARFCGVVRVTEAVRGLPPYLIDYVDEVDRSAPPTPARFDLGAPLAPVRAAA